MDVVLTSVRQRSLNGPTRGLVPSGNGGGEMGVGGGLHIQKSSPPASRGTGKTQPHFLGFGAAVPSKPQHRPCLLLLPLQATAGLSVTGPSAVLWGARCNKKLDSLSASKAKSKLRTCPEQAVRRYQCCL